jgi:TonB family protein
VSTLRLANRTFKRALIFSAAAHVVLIALIAASPKLPGSGRPGMIRYIPLDLSGLSGGSGRSGGRPAGPPPGGIKKESLRDLTTLQNMPAEPKPGPRYPMDKPGRDKKAQAEKKAAIRQAQPGAKSKSSASASDSSSAGGYGSGVRIGGSSGSGDGLGLGTGYSSQIGLADFPYTYYLQIITDRVSSNWFTSLVDPGVQGQFQSVVYFKIYRNGQISEVKVQESSGLRSLDLSAIRAVQRSAPLPPLPRDYGKEYLGIYLIFEHSK